MYKAGVGKLVFTVIAGTFADTREGFSLSTSYSNAAEIHVYLSQSRILMWPDIVSLPKLS